MDFGEVVINVAELTPHERETRWFEMDKGVKLKLAYVAKPLSVLPLNFHKLSKYVILTTLLPWFLHHRMLVLSVSCN